VSFLKEVPAFELCCPTATSWLRVLVANPRREGLFPTRVNASEAPSRTADKRIVEREDVEGFWRRTPPEGRVTTTGSMAEVDDAVDVTKVGS
jgi:hypothetical protein